jgi:phosphoribosylaminoimidazole-succinocarboxamide synthase
MQTHPLPPALPDAVLPGWPDPIQGKVRVSYDLPDERRLLIATDRLSAFDRILAVIPDKGRVLTQTARHWFEATADICPNHVLDYPDPNAVLARRVRILPIEMVVRGYLAGTTSTSILTLYRSGARQMYGHTLPEGLHANEALPAPIITPTTKAAQGEHDAPLSAGQIVRDGLLPAALWEEVSAAALALFARGQALAARRGLILADTKYEFGLDADGRLLLADEVHTPDSSRYWLAEGYAAALSAGTRPPSFDKDVIRAWVAARCDPYRDPIPEIPPAMIAATAAVYLDAHARITGTPLPPPPPGVPLTRLVVALARLAPGVRDG